MTANEKLRVRAHQGGTYAKRQVTLPHLVCGHLITAPASMAVTRMPLLHFGQGISNSVKRRICNLGPSMIDGGAAIGSFYSPANVIWSHKILVYQSSHEKSGQWNFRLIVLVDERFEKQREWSGF